MRIRAITMGLDWRTATPAAEARAGRAVADLRAAADALEMPARTVRLALPALDLDPAMAAAQAASIMAWAQPVAERLGARWLCAPFDVSGAHDRPELYQAAQAVLTRHPNVFVNFVVARDGRLNPAAARSVARFILGVSRLSNNGFDNFRVGASLNCAPLSPYFPFARHEGADGFALAVESTALFLDVVEAARARGAAPADPEALRELVLGRLEPRLAALDAEARRVADAHGLVYGGIDASLAPFPDGQQSVARLLERLGPDRAGQGGTLWWTAWLTNCLKAAFARAGARMAGFNGVMYSVLEDDDLARAAALRHVALEKLLLFSAVCGCGIDMVPVPGASGVDDIAALIHDTAALSTVLRKPLGVRVLPVPHAAAGDATAFNHDYLVDTRVMELPPTVLAPALGALTSFGYLSVPAAPTTVPAGPLSIATPMPAPPPARRRAVPTPRAGVPLA